MLKIIFDLTQFERVEIVPIADVHIGNILCDIQALHDIISYVLKEPDDPNCARICVLNGDLTESVTRKSVGNIFDMTMTPQIQVATMIEMLKPLTFKEDVIIPAVNNTALIQKTITYVVTNAFLRYGDYSQRSGMKPSTIKVPKIFINQGRYKGDRFINVEVLL